LKSNDERLSQNDEKLAKTITALTDRENALERRIAEVDRFKKKNRELSDELRATKAALKEANSQARKAATASGTKGPADRGAGRSRRRGQSRRRPGRKPARSKPARRGNRRPNTGTRDDLNPPGQMPHPGRAPRSTRLSATSPMEPLPAPHRRRQDSRRPRPPSKPRNSPTMRRWTGSGPARQP
jgi:hypothetical protein